MASLQQKLLEILFDHRSRYISGQKISDKLGCSRTAIWKHVKALETKGYHIESVHKKGYRLLSAPNQLSEGEIYSGLKTDHLGKQIVYHDSLPSTQKLAHHLAEDGAPHGLIVLADEQISGRGRLGRDWYSKKGSGIWMSLILRPEIPPQQAPQLTLLVAVAVVKAIITVTQVECQIKWPNDILFEGKKLVGILTELQAETGLTKAVIIGIGMNVSIQKEDLPESIQSIATSLNEMTGKSYRRSEIIQEILYEVEKLYKIYIEEGFTIVKLLWESYAVTIGRRVKARSRKGKSIEGLAKGINNEGVLIIEDDYGMLHHIYSADIELSSSPID